MIRKLFIYSTTLFWLAVLGFWGSGLFLPAEQAGAAAVAADRSYLLAEVAKHNKQNDCWMAIRGEVYDLSAYLPQHPSEPSIVLPWCGKESTQAYVTKTMGRPHSPYADQLLPKYRIGKLNESR